MSDQPQQRDRDRERQRQGQSPALPTVLNDFFTSSAASRPTFSEDNPERGSDEYRRLIRERYSQAMNRFQGGDSTNGAADEGGSQDDEDSGIDTERFERFMRDMQSFVTPLFNEEWMSSNIDTLREGQGIPEGELPAYLDSLERLDKKKMKKDDCCPICTNDYLSDPHCLVVRLPCNAKHHFDIECIEPWLKSSHTCPICRADVLAKKVMPVIEDSEEEDDDWEMYG